MLLLKRALLGSYDNLNFEMILHAIETLAALSRLEAATPETLRPAFSAFCDISPRWEELLNYDALQTLAFHMLQAIVIEVREASAKFGAEGSSKVGGFFEAIASSFLSRIFTLNYDDMLEKSGLSYFDGFDSKGNFEAGRFASQWADDHLLCHLHGSIYFGVVRNGVVRIMKSPNSQEALPRIAWERVIAQSREEIFIGPIISGLRKTEKLLFQPFSLYHNALVSSFVSSPRILIVGYGYRDTYINHWLLNAREIHGPSLRVAFVTAKTEVEQLAEEQAAKFLTFFCNRDDVKPCLTDLQKERYIFGNRDVLLIADGDAFSHAERLLKFFEN